MFRKFDLRRTKIEEKNNNIFTSFIYLFLFISFFLTLFSFIDFRISLYLFTSVTAVTTDKSKVRSGAFYEKCMENANKKMDDEDHEDPFLEISL